MTFPTDMNPRQRDEMATCGQAHEVRGAGGALYWVMTTPHADGFSWEVIADDEEAPADFTRGTRQDAIIAARKALETYVPVPGRWDDGFTGTTPPMTVRVNG